MVDEALPVSLDSGTEKQSGFIMKITQTGMLVELEKITFKVGAYLTAVFELENGMLLTERVRSMKHYDRYFRQQPKKKLKEGEIQPVPKKLAEFHFYNLTESTKTQITKYLLRQQRDFDIKKK